MNQKLEVIFENDDIIVINKQANEFVLSSEEHKETIQDILKNKLQKEVFPITSLDYEASGIILFAKNKNTYNFVCEQFKKEQVKKSLLYFS